jgi:hypothetical protein
MRYEKQPLEEWSLERQTLEKQTAKINQQA